MSRAAKIQRRRPEAGRKPPSSSQSGWERQADEAASRFAARRPSSARWLSPAAAASYQLPSSPGIALPAKLRAELESGFNADLSEVRIHRDSAASAAVRDEQAVAFAAGRDIFFDSSAGALDTASGRELLAHEVAHVLQQTGREDGEGRLRATAITGPGELQRKGDGSKRRRDQHIDFDALVTAHTAFLKKDQRMFGDVVSAVRKQLGGQLDETSQGAQDLADGITRNKGRFWNFLQQSEAAGGYLCDVLKFTDHFDAAAVCLERWPVLHTYARVDSLADYYVQKVDKDEDFFNEVAAAHPLLKHYWPGLFLDTFNLLLYGPSLAIRPLADSHDVLWTEAAKKYSEDHKADALTDNELVFLAAQQLTAFDEQRVKRLTLMEAEISKTTDRAKYPVSFALNLSMRVAKWAAELKTDPLGLIRGIGDRIETIASEAVRYWNSILSADFSFVLAPEGTDIKIKSKVRQIPHDKLFTEQIPKALKKASAAFFKVKPNLELPDPAAYASQIALGVAGLRKFAVDELEIRLVNRARTDAGDDFGIALGWFILQFQKFLNFAESYATGPDIAFGKTFDGVPDVRFAHRLQLARNIAELADHLQSATFRDWKDLREQMQGVLENRTEGSSRLAILGEWEPAPGVPISRIADDFHKKITFTDIAPSFTPTVVADLYLLIYYRDLTTQLQNQLSVGALELANPRAALHNKSLLSRAVDAANGSSRPVRYVVPRSQWEYAQNPKDDDEFFEIVGRHPKTKKLIDDEDGRHREIFHSDDPYEGKSTELFLWSFPQPRPIFASLHKINALNALVATRSAQPLASIQHLSDDDWVTKLGAAAEGGIDSALVEIIKQARAELTKEIRLAVSHERKLITELIERVLPDAPLDILERIKSFYYWVMPPEDRQAQLTVLILAIAPGLRDALEYNDQFSVINAWYGFLTRAQAASEGAKLDDLKRVVPDAELAQLIQNRPALLSLIGHFDDVRSTVQGRFGFFSDDGHTLQALGDDVQIEPGKAFVLNGERFRLEHVNRPFIYLKPYGFKGTGAYKPPTIDGKVWGAGYVPTGQTLFTIFRGRDESGRGQDAVRVTDTDIEQLNFYTDLIEQESTLVALPALIDLGGEIFTFALDLAEKVPEVGLAVRAARVEQFLLSEDFRDLLKFLGSGPVGTLKDIAGQLATALSPGNLVIFLLFPHLPGRLFNWLNAIAAESGPEKEPKGPFEKIVAIIRSIGRGFKWVWNVLKAKFGIHARNLRIFVLSHPLLSLFIDFVADHLHYVTDVKQFIDRNIKNNDLIAALTTGVKASFKSMIDGLTDLVLPEKVIPVSKITRYVIDALVETQGFEAKAVRDLLDDIGLADKINGLVTRALEYVVDPNEYWRTEIREPIRNSVQTFGQGLADDAYNLLARLLAQDSLDEKADITVLSEEGFPESDMFRDSEVPLTHGPPVYRPAPGTPMTASARGAAEQRFGHDFSHVRLHTGQEARSLTSTIGAAGLTTGSHVYLDPSVPPNSAKGRHVLNHELTHVLQQTGSRPLGGDYSPNPRAGRQGGGIRYDAVQESAAERVAHSVDSRYETGPVDPGPSRSGGGYQPGIFDDVTLRRLLKRLTGVDAIQRTQSDIDSNAGAEPRNLDADQVQIGRTIWNQTRAMVGTDLPTSGPNLKSVEDDFVTYFKNVATDVPKAVPWIAFEVSELITEQTPGGDPVQKRIVKPEKFVTGLQEYLLARSGILLRISLDGPDVKGVRVETLLLAMVSGGSNLWTRAMEGVNADDKAELRPLFRAKLRELNTKTIFVAIDPSTALVSGIPRLVRVWENDRFAFSADFIAIVKQEAAASKEKGRPDKLPPFAEYIDFRKNKVSRSPGIMIGKYGDRLKGPDRESHHTTQFLLIEYFRNKSDNKPFPTGTPGVVFGDENEAVRFEAPSLPPIKFKTLDTGERGDDMPAILLSRPTHRGANLHVSGAKAEDFPDGGIPVTQGEKVHSTFLAQLKTAGAATIEEADRAKIYTAIQGTYGFMHRHMFGTLFSGLTQNECTYYAGIVARDHTVRTGATERLDPAYTPDPDKMQAVYAEALRNNDDTLGVVGGNGWIFR